MTTDRSDVAADLRSWARGMHCTEAATLILIRAFGGRFAQPGWPWIARSRHDGSFYIDADRMSDDDIGMLSGGEQRTLAIARSLLGSEPVDLSEAMPGLDRSTSRLVINALAHAAGEPTVASGGRDPLRRSPRASTRNASQHPTTVERTGRAR